MYSSTSRGSTDRQVGDFHGLNSWHRNSYPTGQNPVTYRFILIPSLPLSPPCSCSCSYSYSSPSPSSSSSSSSSSPSSSSPPKSKPFSSLSSYIARISNQVRDTKSTESTYVVTKIALVHLLQHSQNKLKTHYQETGKILTGADSVCISRVSNQSTGHVHSGRLTTAWLTTLEHVL